MRKSLALVLLAILFPALASADTRTDQQKLVGDREKHFPSHSTACEMRSFSLLFACSPTILG